MHEALLTSCMSTSFGYTKTKCGKGKYSGIRNQRLAITCGLNVVKMVEHLYRPFESPPKEPSSHSRPATSQTKKIKK